LGPFKPNNDNYPKIKINYPRVDCKKKSKSWKNHWFLGVRLFFKKKCLDVQHLKLLNSNPLFLQRQLGVGPALQGLRVSVGKICKLAPATHENTCEKLANIRETNATPNDGEPKKFRFSGFEGGPTWQCRTVK
jgi:hypothetical protein